MATRASIATGNFTTAGTWGLVDATSFAGGETGSEVLTTAFSGTRSQPFTPGAITVSHIGVKLSVRTGTTGTISVHLALNSTHVEVAGTLVTINTADLPVAATADLNGGWIFFKLSAPVLLAGATAYELEALTSSAAQVSLFRTDATADNLSRALITTTTGAPAAGDDLIVAGEKTGAGTGNAFVVTMDNTAATDFGSTPTAANSLLTPGISIATGGTLSFGSTAATNYLLKISNSIVVYSGGTFNIGTTGTPIPRGGTAKLNFDCGANVDYGLIIRNLGSFVAQGLSRTSGKNIISCKLNTDEAIASTSLGVDTDTGWLDNDEIAVASTTQTNTQTEKGALNGAAGASTLTVDGFGGAGGGLAAAHSGTSPTQAEVVLLTRSVQIFGASASLQSYIDIKATATVDVDWIECFWMGSATSNKRGLDIATTSSGNFNWQFSSLHDFTVASSRGLNINGAAYTNITFSNNVSYLIANVHCQLGGAGTSCTISDCIFLRNTDSGAELFQINPGAAITQTISTITCAGGIDEGVVFNSGAPFGGTINGLTCHSNAGKGITFFGQSVRGTTATLQNFTIWRNGNSGIDFQSSGNVVNTNDLIIDTLTLFGNGGGQNIQGTGSYFGITLINLTSSGDTTFATTSGIGSTPANGIVGLKIINGDFSTVTGIKVAHTADISLGSDSHVEIALNNTKLGAATEISGQANMSINGYVSSQKHDQTAGLHKTWKRFGTITIETTTVHTGGQSIKLTPNNASNKLESGSFFVPVASGASITPTVYVFEDAAYNGARSRLILKRNDAIGISADTVIDTATASSDAAWEGLTGTTASATDDGVMEFVVDCDGTAGNLFVDSFSVV